MLCQYCLLLSLIPQISRNLLLFLLLFPLFLLHDENGVFIAVDDLLIDGHLLLFLLDDFLFLLPLQLFHLVQQDLRLSLLLLPGLQSLDLPSLNLLDDYLFALQCLVSLPLLNLLLLLYLFEALEFHDFVLFLLLGFVALPLPLFLLQLSLSDGGCLSISNHLVHLLDIVELLLGNLNGLLINLFPLLVLLLLNIVEGDVLLLFLL